MDNKIGVNGENGTNKEAVTEELVLVAGTARRASFIPEFRGEDCKLDVVWDPEAEVNVKKSALVGGRPPIENFETSSLSEDAIDEEIIECDVVSGVTASIDEVAHVEEEELAAERVERRVSAISLHEMLSENNLSRNNPITNGIPEADESLDGDHINPESTSNAFSLPHGNLSSADSATIPLESELKPDLNIQPVIKPAEGDTIEISHNFEDTSDLTKSITNNESVVVNVNTDSSLNNLLMSSDSSASEIVNANGEVVNSVGGGLVVIRGGINESAPQVGQINEGIEDPTAVPKEESAPNQESINVSVGTKISESSVTVIQPESQKLHTKSKSKGVLGVFKRSPKPKHQVNNKENAAESPKLEFSGNGHDVKSDKSAEINGKKSGFFSFGTRGKEKPAKAQTPDKISHDANPVEATISNKPPSSNGENEIKAELSIKTDDKNVSEIPVQNLTLAEPTKSGNILHPEGNVSGSSVKPGAELQSSGFVKLEQVENRSYTAEVSPGQSNAATEAALHRPGNTELSKYVVVVAIDFGTAFSGYAFSFVRDPESIHMMSRWEGGDPGILNQKTPTILLLNPEGKFHSFGFTARNLYHDLSPEESSKWLYFDKFKMSLYKNSDCNKETMIEAANGQKFPALEAVRMTLAYFKDHALQELSDQCGTEIINNDVRWIVTVPAIWNAAAKQFMRQAAYQAGLATANDPDQLVIALEPEAASVHIRKLRLHMLVPDKPYATLPLSIKRKSLDPTSLETVSSQFKTVTRYMVVDCGGGTVDIAVHDVNAVTGLLQEVYKASGGAHGSAGIDADFETLLVAIFGEDFIKSYRQKRPSGWVALMMAFESRKRAANPLTAHQPSNVALPFSFIDYHKKLKNTTVEKAISDFGEPELRWSSQGMLRMSPEAMKILFQTTVDGIIESVATVFNKISGIQNIFLVGGLSESAIIQHAMREKFGSQARIIVPQEANLAVLKGAVCYGLDPGVVAERRSKLTYGAAVLHRFIPGKHPQSKLIHKDGADWCKDVFDHFVVVDQIVRREEPVVRSYTPASTSQSHIIISIYSSEYTDVQFVTDPHVTKCATITLDLARNGSYGKERRRIQTYMTFAETEVKVTALDTATGEKVYASIDFFKT